MDKPTVLYQTHKAQFIEPGRRAFIKTAERPRWVSTSPVQLMGPMGQFETLNTNYAPVNCLDTSDD